MMNSKELYNKGGPRTVLVTRHAGLVEYLREIGLVDDQTEIVEHATRKDVQGARVIGNLPLDLAVYAAEVVTIPLSLTPEDRGQEFTLERVREIAGDPRGFKVYYSRGGI